MLIAGIPISDENSASCRIRFFRFLKNLPEGYKWKRFDGSYDFDVLYVQKIAKDDVLDIVEKAKRKGKKVVFDRDDIRKDWGGPNHEKMMQLADAVTTDTELRRDDFQKHARGRVCVVQDCIDYIDSTNSRIDISMKTQSCVTFGHKASVGKAAPYLNSIRLPEKAYICSEKMKEIDGQFVEWKLDKFISKLRKFDIAVLVHDDTDIGNMKSNNRLLVCMSIGLPVITSNTDAYRNTLKDTNHEWLVAKEPRDCNDILEILEDPKVRANVSNGFLNYVWFHYSPKTSGRQLANVFDEVMSK